MEYPKPDLLEKAAELFKIFGDRTRLDIFQAIDARELSVSEIADAVGMSQSSVSHHLRVMRQADLVRARKRGRRVSYRIADRHVKSILRESLEHLKD